MPSFTNRPGYGEPLPQSSDSYREGAGGYPSIPRAPRAPHFPEASVRGAQSARYNPTGPFQPQSHAFSATGPFPAQSHRSGIPSAPSSLSPMALASARSAVATGPQQTMDAGPSRPSAKAGMSILLAGAIIGGLIGAVMHARQNAAEAMLASQPQRDVPAATASFTPPPLPEIKVVAPPEKKDGILAAKDPLKDKDPTDKKKDDEKDKAETKKKGGSGKKVWGSFAAAKPKDTTTTASAGGDEPESPKPAKVKKGGKDDDGYTIASAGGDNGDSSKPEKESSKPTPKKVTAEKEPAPKPEKEKAEKPSKASKGGDDAVNVLKAAMGATENTL